MKEESDMIERFNDQYDLWYKSEGIQNLEEAELNEMLVTKKKSGIMAIFARFFEGLAK